MTLHVHGVASNAAQPMGTRLQNPETGILQRLQYPASLPALQSFMRA